MRRRATQDTPSYAAETGASAQLSGSHLGASIGLFLALLAGMSAVEIPIPRWTASGVETPTQATHGDPATARAAGVTSACAGTPILRSHPPREAHARAT